MKKPSSHTIADYVSAHYDRSALFLQISRCLGLPDWRSKLDGHSSEASKYFLLYPISHKMAFLD